MSSKTSKQTSTKTVTKNGKTVKIETTVETTTDPSGKTTTTTTTIETTTNPDGSTSKSTKISTETSSKSVKHSKKSSSTSNDDDEFEKMKREMEADMKKPKKEKKESLKKPPALVVDKNEAQNINQFFKMTNDYRKKNGKPALKLDDSMSAIEKEHNDMMLSGKRALGHEGFRERSKRIENSVSAAENVAYCTDRADYLDNLFISLVNDPPHRENLLGNYNSVGISIGKNSSGEWIVSQIFARINK